MTPNTLAVGMPGGWEWLAIAGVALLVFGGRKLPELARAMGSSINQFKRGLREDPEPPDDGSKKPEEPKAKS